jgi:hypothetical protein
MVSISLAMISLSEPCEKEQVKLPHKKMNVKNNFIDNRFRIKTYFPAKNTPKCVILMLLLFKSQFFLIEKMSRMNFNRRKQGFFFVKPKK